MVQPTASDIYTGIIPAFVSTIYVMRLFHVSMFIGGLNPRSDSTAPDLI